MTRDRRKYRAYDLAHNRKYCEENPAWVMLHQAKGRAKKHNLPFDICEEDIHIPEVCPVLKQKLVRRTIYAPSLDRMVPELGYIKGNIQVISMKANKMKNNATQEELKNFAIWINQSIL